MKRIFFLTMTASAIIIFHLTSCKKDTFSPVPGGNSSVAAPSSTTTMNLVAYDWVKDANGVYSNTFAGVISAANSNNHRVKIYVVENGNQTQINNPISFRGGELWAAYTQTDVKINYHASDKSLPFSHLIIKVVIE